MSESAKSTAVLSGSAPGWFDRAIAQRPEHRTIVVEDGAIHFRVWGPQDAPGLILVHGGAAHSGWWDHIAPLLGDLRVAAIDLSGHGDSCQRAHYSMSLWAREVTAVAGAAGMRRPIVVGHSLGGWVALTTGVERGDAVAGVAIIDSPLYDQPPEEAKLRARRPRRPYADLNDALARFRTTPGQDVLLPYVRDHVARESVRRVNGGWTWKFDPGSFAERRPIRELLPELERPIALFRCERGLVSAAMAAEMQTLVSRRLPIVVVPDAGHHPMFDQPLALVTGLRTLVELWPEGAPRPVAEGAS